jgi:phage-related protein
MAALPLQTRISQASQQSIKYRILLAQFGDGYSQRSADGINNKDETWTIFYQALTLTEMTQVRDFLDGLKGASTFDWTATGDSTSKKWRVVDEVVVIPLGGNLYSLSFTCKREYDL